MSKLIRYNSQAWNVSSDYDAVALLSDPKIWFIVGREIDFYINFFFWFKFSKPVQNININKNRKDTNLIWIVIYNVTQCCCFFCFFFLICVIVYVYSVCVWFDALIIVVGIKAKIIGSPSTLEDWLTTG